MNRVLTFFIDMTTAQVANKPVMIDASADPTGGDGTLAVTVEYDVITLQ